MKRKNKLVEDLTKVSLLPLTDDFVFKAVFGKYPDVLLDLLNSFPEFQKDKKIKEIKILNPEIPKNSKDDKLSILDIKAEDISGNKFFVEMQASSKPHFAKRTLYYWSKLYSGSLIKGEKYDKLQKVYSFNFVNFNIIEGTNSFHSVFQLLEKSNPEIRLTDVIEVHIIELKKFSGKLENLKNPLEEWLYTLTKISNLGKGEMKTLEKKNPKVKKAINAVKFVSLDKDSREYYEYRLKAELDYNTGMSHAYETGLQKGIEQGLEKGRKKGKSEGIQEEKEKTALQLISKGMDFLFISEVTGLSITRIKELQRLISRKKKG